ncbi:hypothetical protein MishRS11D_07690 [Methylomagnum ishizawai]|nr:hypothetical protein MishRS11D_07690 [Methylomagnum ishizawai]
MATNNPAQTQARLTQIAMAVKPQGMIADMVLPRVGVPAELFKYTKFATAEAFTIPDTRIGRASTANEVEFTAELADGSTKDWGLDDFVPKKDMDKFASGEITYDPMAVASENTALLVALAREKRIADLIFGLATYAASLRTTLSGSDQWSHTSSDPVAAIDNAAESMLLKPNVLVLGRRTWKHLRKNQKLVAAVLARDGVGAAPGVRIVVASNFPNERGKKRTIAHDYDVFRRVQRASASEGVCAWPPVDKRGGRGTEHEPLDLEGLDEKEITRGGTRRGEAGEASRGLAPGGTVGGVAGEPWLGRGSPERLVPGARPVRPPAGRLEAGLLPGSRGHGRGIDERPGTAGPQGAQPEPRTGIGA